MVRHVEPFDSMKLQEIGYLHSYDRWVGIKHLAIPYSLLLWHCIELGCLLLSW
jgi:hypothetical protein